jgi:hypothetical protein
MRELQVAVASTRRNSLILVAVLLICCCMFVVCVKHSLMPGSGLNLTEIVLEASARLIHTTHTSYPGLKVKGIESDVIR